MASRSGDEHAREREHGPWRLLAVPRVYTWFQNQMAVSSARQQVAAFIAAHPGDTVLDVGCGPADILRYLPAVDYVGLDLNPQYLAEARSRHPQASFFEMDIRALPPEWLQRFDRILAQGVLHHFGDDDAVALLKRIGSLLAPGGRLITVDPAFARDQSVIARVMAVLDRGRHVRTVEEYERLARRVFDRVNVSVRHDLMRIPYTHLLMECAVAS